MMKKPKAILVNPPIYDFAAYDFWLKPIGLLRIAQFLKRNRIPFLFFDFLDRLNPLFPPPPPSKDPYGRGKFLTEKARKPSLLKKIPRKFKRYGAPLQIFERKIREFGKPDFVLITSGMTYWYLGIKEVVEIVRRIYPHTTIILGGTYPTLLPEHASSLDGIDYVVKGDNLYPLGDLMGIEIPNFSPPLWDVYPNLFYGVIKITRGCPFRCTYCAVPYISPVFEPVPFDEVFHSLNYFKRRGINDIVFYDDALLFKKEEVLFPFLRKLRSSGFKFRFHTPNAIHASYIDYETAKFLKEEGFVSIFLGFETANEERQKITGGKVSTEALLCALDNLEKAGYRRNEITVYIMLGLPFQPLEEVEQSINFVNKAGAKVMISEFSPVPNTEEWKRAKEIFPFYDPLFENNTVFPLLLYGEKAVNRLKELARRLNRSL